jgi:hypothetical protein
MNDQTLRTIDDQDLMDAVGGGGCDDFEIEVELEVEVSLGR